MRKSISGQEQTSRILAFSGRPILLRPVPEKEPEIHILAEL